MTAKDLKFSFEARDRLLHGIDVLASVVRVTLGPRGRNVAIDRSFGAKITKDGVSVAKEIELGDKFENMGVQLVRQVADKTSYRTGDGTTTAVVLAHAIARSGAKAVAAGMNPMDLKRGIDRAVEAVVEELKKAAKIVTSNAEIAQIGTISANGDTEIGGYIAEAMQKVGNTGVITIEEGTSLKTELDSRHRYPVRSQLHLSPFRHQPQQGPGGDGGRLSSDQREEARKPRRIAAPAGEGRPDRQAAAHRRRRRRGRNRGRARGQQAARRSQSRGRQAAGVW